MKAMKALALAVVLAVVLAAEARAFYLPGVIPKEYAEGQVVPLLVNKLTSTRTQLSYHYYDLPFCEPEEGVKDMAENLGELLAGNVIQSSPYEVNMYKTVHCAVLCGPKTYSPEEVAMFEEKIDEQYLVNMIMDNLPPTYKTVSEVSVHAPAFYSEGFPIGGTVLNGALKQMFKFLNNHLTLTVLYHIPDDVREEAKESGEEGSDALPGRIVGLFAEPFSIKHKFDSKTGTVANCPSQADDASLVRYGQHLNSDDKKPLEVVWTYSVKWEASEIKWASRWDMYLDSKNKSSDDIHWFSIYNSLFLVVFLTGMLAMILMRTLLRDPSLYNLVPTEEEKAGERKATNLALIPAMLSFMRILYHKLSRCNRVPTEEEKAEERKAMGSWKLVHGDVYRPPANPMLFSATVGTGTQVLATAMFTIVFAATGFLSPANRGSLVIAPLLLFMLLGISAGYFSARTYKMFNGSKYKQCTLLTALLYPSVVMGCIFGLNLVIWAESPSSAIPFTSMLAVLSLWFCISVPLTFLGAFYGYRRDADKQPVQTQEIPRPIPEQPFYRSPFASVLAGGIPPFGVVFTENFFILSSIWMGQYYHAFGFLLLVFVILVVTCAGITIGLCYYHLLGGNYHCWWRSVLVSGSGALYMFLYSVFYFFTKLKMDLFVSVILYFGCMFILSLLFFLATGVIGYFACYWFITKILAKYATVQTEPCLTDWLTL